STPNGRGTLDAGPTVDNSLLRLHYGSRESIDVKNNGLVLLTNGPLNGESPYEGHVTLHSGTLGTYLFSVTNQRPTYAIVNPIVVDGGGNTIAGGLNDKGGRLRLTGG